MFAVCPVRSQFCWRWTRCRITRGKLIRVLGDEAHTRKNIEKMLEYENKSGQTTVRPNGCFEIVFQA